MNCFEIAQQKHFVHNPNLLYFQWRHNSYNNDIQHNDTQPNDIQRETKSKGFAKCHLCWMSQIFPLYWVGGGVLLLIAYTVSVTNKNFFLFVEQGKLEMWVDMFPMDMPLPNLPVDVSPRAQCYKTF